METKSGYLPNFSIGVDFLVPQSIIKQFAFRKFIGSSISTNSRVLASSQPILDPCASKLPK